MKCISEKRDQGSGAGEQGEIKNQNAEIKASNQKSKITADFLGIKGAKWGKNGLKCSIKI
jgi:hypothetical protein